MAISRPLSVVAVALIATTATACSTSSDAGNASRFCGEVEANTAAITSPDLATSDAVEPLLELYREIGELAPLAIEAEWAQLTLNVETASTVVPGDAESEQRAIAEALRSEQSAVKVSRWLRENCGVDIGPVATIAPLDN